MNPMQTYGPRGIKEIIEAFPAVKEALDTYGIGCGACEPGTCLFKDIVALHPLSTDQEKALMERLTAILEDRPPDGMD